MDISRSARQITLPFGSRYLGDNTTSFCVWAPTHETIEVVVSRQPHLPPQGEASVGGASPRLGLADCRSAPPPDRGEGTRGKPAVHLLQPTESGYHTGIIENTSPGSLYTYRIDGGEDRPDPASRFQPEGVHGPSAVIDNAFSWTDRAWHGIPLRDYILYELHVGTFTPEGTFDAATSRLDYLADLGVTAVELMPVAQFPGGRNWGYDGVYPFATQSTYGGPDGLRRLVDACHAKGLAVVLDVVYNHLGPEGNYLAEFAPYFTDRYRTPWGQALNFDGPGSDNVRRYFIENALHWLFDFHIDALRLDAVNAIVDVTPRTFLEQLSYEVDERALQENRSAYLIAESSDDNARLITPREMNGQGMHAQWNDDFHHCVHTLLTGETGGYYQDYGSMAHLEKCYRDGFAYSGEFSHFRARRHGTSSRALPPERFVVFAQNHDQIGNRMLGERLNRLVGFEQVKLAAGLALLSPYIPLLFMGEEYGETAPFQFFISHTDPDLIEAVRKGRREEFAGFLWAGDPPDPQSEDTFRSCVLNPELRNAGEHKLLFELHRELIRIRKTEPALASPSKDRMDVRGNEIERTLKVRRWAGAASAEAILAYNLSDAVRSMDVTATPGDWRTRIDSADGRWGGPGPSTAPSSRSTGVLPLIIQPGSFILMVRNYAKT